MRKEQMPRIGVIGAGYVGISNALVLSQKNSVTLYDIDQSKIDMLRNSISPIAETGVNKFLQKENLNITYCDDGTNAFQNKDFIVIATPTSYDSELNSFDLSSVKASVKKAIANSPESLIVIKSTIPIGCIDSLRSEFNHNKIIFSPEFLREGLSIEDNLNPSRIIIGGECKQSKYFGNLLLESTTNKDAPLLFMCSKSAESVKLFANNYLAMRVSFFNELDSFAMNNEVDAQDIINGMKHDIRIGDYYNNPSFGYGGYCLPKDTKQLLANFSDTPQNIFSAIVDSNETRKKFISQAILARSPKSIGIYRLNMKAGSDNFRDSAILDLIKFFSDKTLSLYVFEPILKDNEFKGCKVVNSLAEFAEKSEIIIANRVDEEIKPYTDKVFTRDIFHNN